MNLPLDCIDTIFKCCDLRAKLGLKMSCKQFYFRYISIRRPPIVSIKCDPLDLYFYLTVSGNLEAKFPIPKKEKAKRIVCDKYGNIEYAIRDFSTCFSLGGRRGNTGVIHSGFHSIFIEPDTATSIRRVISKARKDADPDDYEAELALANA